MYFGQLRWSIKNMWHFRVILGHFRVMNDSRSSKGHVNKLTALS